MTDTRERETFGAEELACCLSHYDLGVVFGIKEFARGSRRAPKVIVECQKGHFLFKRRNKGVEEVKKVAFTHQIQLRLAEQNFPLPHLLGTRDENNSMLVLHDRIYEMQEYIVGSIYDGSLPATEQGGHALGLYHKLLMDFESDFEPVTASYHNAKAIHQAIQKTASALQSRIETHPPLRETIQFLQNSYYHCAESVNNLGLRDWPMQIVHGDWHPGNMLFQDHLVVAVIDYDTARLQQRVIDLANGALQFSIVGGGANPADWPEHLDLERFGRFLAGYDAVNVITTDELRAIPFLMCEAMIAEAAIPIAQTGMFGRFDGGDFLTMIQKKVRWIFSHVNELAGIMSDEAGDADPYAPAVEPVDPAAGNAEEQTGPNNA
ncbi:MAG: phosphotransferase [Phycisphaerae bacterium]|nr:phosphotransferase [Phycisphaerae bacterium]